VVDNFVNSLTNSVLSLVAPNITPEFPNGASMPAVSIPSPPTFTAPVWVSPNIPTAITEVLDVGDLSIAPFDEDPPVIVYGSAPAPFTAPMPDAPGVDLSFVEPTLSVSLPAPPSLLSIDVGSFGGMNMPTFDADSPELTAVAPSIREYTPGAQYSSALLTATKDTLLQRIQNGGTGIGDVEQQIWERGREREARSAADSIAKLEQMEEMGYALPPGIYVDARIKITTESEYAERGLSREVMVKSAELQLDNVKHALSTAVQLEGQLMSYTNSVEQRLFESTRYATEAGVTIYNAKVQAFAAMTDVYRAKVGVYEAQVRAETAKVDAYRAQVGAEEAKARVNQALVEQYRVQIDAALSNIKIYEARIAGIQAKADIEKTKVMVFGEQVKGYVAQINAYTAGVEGYRATLSAEQTKQQVFQSRVDAFTAQVNASARQIDARISAYKGRIEAKTAEFDGYRAAVAGESARVDALAKASGVVADTYRSQVTAVLGYNEVLTKQWQATLDQNQRTAEIAINTAKANADLYISTRSLALDAAKTGASVSAQIGAAAINAFNVSASVSSSEGYNASESVSNANSISNVTSTSTSTSTSTNYNYNV
jgi:hypothetical protein